MNKLLLRLAGIDDNCIQVSGGETFPEHLWRKAVVYYLNGVWADNWDIMHRPKIMFGGVTLRLDSERGIYYAYGKPYEIAPSLKDFNQSQLLTTSCYQVDVEQALIRFVKNNQIRLLTVNLTQASCMFLWKKHRRGQYGCSAEGIQTDLH